jgi:hypothetical protein
MSEKVTCAICKNEVNKKCTVKKNSAVALNKRRRCDLFELEPGKVKTKQILKTVRMTYEEKEALRKEYKEQLKLYKQAVKEAKQGKVPHSGSSKHPLTGDLSRFVSTVED